MAAVPRYVALRKADETYGLPPGVCARWLDEGLLHRVFFQDHGEIVVGVRTTEVAHVVARMRARQIARARGRPTSVR